MRPSLIENSCLRCREKPSQTHKITDRKQASISGDSMACGFVRFALEGKRHASISVAALCEDEVWGHEAMGVCMEHAVPLPTGSLLYPLSPNMPRMAAHVLASLHTEHRQPDACNALSRAQRARERIKSTHGDSPVAYTSCCHASGMGMCMKEMHVMSGAMMFPYSNALQ